ncbi:MAG TPA: hypothetical protein VFV95_05955 [Vicinamibacterales bacterium]|nr:hypothetical protein [Vicinamibacterales bacterium]
MWGLSRTLLVAILLLATIACGKKGPPLLPFVRIPAAAEVTEARRVGDGVYVTVSVPTADVDGATPASVATIEIYAVTADAAPSPGLGFPLVAETLVATIPVAPAADPPDRSGTVVPDPKTGALQGQSVTILDPLTPEKLAPTVLPAPKTPRGGRQPAAIPEPETSQAPQLLRRYYIAVPFSRDRRRSGPPSTVIEVPLMFVPGKVPAPRAEMKGHAIELTWEPSGGLIGWFLDRPLPPEVPLSKPQVAVAPQATAKPSTSTSPATGPTLYNVYREVAPDPLALQRRPPEASSWEARPETPINPKPIPELSFLDDVPFDDRLRCYQVRAVRGTGAQQVESEPSETVCKVPVDLDPPAAVTGLSATEEGGAITLRWEPNGEEDLGGYIVLRRELGGDTLLRLTPEPITKTSFTDSSKELVSGRMYIYVVHAVDTRIPLPNMSDPADTTITAR